MNEGDRSERKGQCTASRAGSPSRAAQRQLAWWGHLQLARRRVMRAARLIAFWSMRGSVVQTAGGVTTENPA